MRNRLTSRVALWLAAICLAGPASAASTDSRLFAVLVDGKPAGECRLTYTSRDDGSLSIAGKAVVRVRHLLGTYHYYFDGSEIRKGDRLQRLGDLEGRPPSAAQLRQRRRRREVLLAGGRRVGRPASRRQRQGILDA